MIQQAVGFMHFHNFTLAAADPNWGGSEFEHAQSGACVSYREEHGV